MHHVFIIKRGDFKLTKKVEWEKQLNENKLDLLYKHKDGTRKIVDPYKLSQWSKAKRLSTSGKDCKNFDVGLYGKGQIFGESTVFEPD